jgi:hypothetical protein
VTATSETIKRKDPSIEAKLRRKWTDYFPEEKDNEFIQEIKKRGRQYHEEFLKKSNWQRSKFLIFNLIQLRERKNKW